MDSSVKTSRFSTLFAMISFLSYSFRTVTRRVLGLILVLSDFPIRFIEVISVLTLKDCRIFLTFSVVGTRFLSTVFSGSSAIPCILKLAEMSDFTFVLEFEEVTTEAAFSSVLAVPLALFCSILSHDFEIRFASFESTSSDNLFSRLESFSSIFKSEIMDSTFVCALHLMNTSRSPLSRQVLHMSKQLLPSSLIPLMATFERAVHSVVRCLCWLHSTQQ